MPWSLLRRVWIVVMISLLPALTSAAMIPSSDANSSLPTLRVLLIAPLPDPYLKPAYDAGHSILPSGLLAVDEINNDTSVLPGYRLEPITGDGGCDYVTKSALEILEHLVYRNLSERIIGVVGPVCSEAAQYVSDIMNVQRIHFPLVTVANSPVLTNHKRYPFTYGVVSTSEAYARLTVDIYNRMRETRKWMKIALFYDSNRLYHLEIYRSILTILKSNCVDLNFLYTSPMTPTYMPLEDVIERGIRVVFVYSSRAPVCYLMCRAFNLNMRYPTYQFIFTDRNLENTFKQCTDTEPLEFTYEHRDYNCSREDMIEAVEMAVFLRFELEGLKIKPNDTTAVSGNTYGQYRTKYTERLYERNMTVEEDLQPTQWAAPFYDAVWALALAVNQTLPNLEFNSRLNVWDGDQLQRSFESLRFQGVSSVVDFDNETGYSSTIIAISRLEKNTETGEFETDLKFYYNVSEPLDKGVEDLFINSAFNTKTDVIPIFAVVGGFVLTVLVLGATIVYHVLHVYFRHRPAIKASSPQLNHIIFAGCYAMLVSILLDTIIEAFLTGTEFQLGICYTVTWFQNIGRVLIFGTLFAKYYRLYLVFLRTYGHRSNLSNTKLSLIVLALVVVNIILFAVWLPFQPFVIVKSAKFDFTTEMPENREKTICRVADRIGIWFQLSLFIYLTLLVLAVLTLSILNRRIKQRDFNTTVTTNIFIYLYIVFPGILFGSTYLDPTVRYIMKNVAFLGLTTCCLIFIFTPPLWQRNRQRTLTITQHLQKISNIVALHRFDSSGLLRRSPPVR